MNAYQKTMHHVRPNDPPFEKGDKVFVDSSFIYGVGGKRAVVQECRPCEGKECSNSGWMVKIDIYENMICSNWLNKLP